MPSEFSVRMTGKDGVLELLAKLPKRTQNKVIPPALRKAAKPIIKSANNKVPKDINITFKGDKEIGREQFRSADIKIKGFIRGKSGNKYILIGAEANSQVFFNFPVWLEFGTLAHRTKGLVKSRSPQAQAVADNGLGIIKQPFMRPAFNLNKNKSKDILSFEILKGIEKQAKKIVGTGKV